MGVPMLVLLTASLGKLADMPLFIASLRTWTLVPRELVMPLAFLVAGLELVLGGWWLFGPRRRLAAIGGAVLLLIFAGVYLVHLAQGISPSCACMGALQAGFEARTEGWTIAARALALAACLLVGAGLSLAGSSTRGSKVVPE